MSRWSRWTCASLCLLAPLLSPNLPAAAHAAAAELHVVRDDTSDRTEHEIFVAVDDGDDDGLLAPGVATLPGATIVARGECFESTSLDFPLPFRLHFGPAAAVRGPPSLARC